MPRLTDDQIANIKQLASERMAEFIGAHVILQRKGRNSIGLCPFHNERTPSFTVTQEKGVYKCFGCGKSGRSAITFIMDFQRLEYIDALRYIANHFNVIL